MTIPYAVDPDITVASTIDKAFYLDPASCALAQDRIFGRTWQWLGDLADVAQHNQLSPRSLLPGLLDEPLLLARDATGTLRCLSNVCTHRGNLLIKAPCQAEQIRCGYHSRRFDMSGTMFFMPEFERACNFPSASDHLPQVPFGDWAGQHGFASITPSAPLNEFIGAMQERMGWLPIHEFVHDPGRDASFEVAAHWALYVENYLEGFHIPFVHPALNQAVDYGSYASELFRYSNLQIALAKDGQPAFDLPANAVDTGKRVAAYYWWVFPNLMFNFYPWGLSVNQVLPTGQSSCKVLFRTYVGDASKLDTGAGSGLNQVEMEDEAVVQAVQQGVRSRFYSRGRYSPTREQGVHHFHRLICEFMAG
jgi:choline monooxygenase